MIRTRRVLVAAVVLVAASWLLAGCTPKRVLRQPDGGEFATSPRQPARQPARQDGPRPSPPAEPPPAAVPDSTPASALELGLGAAGIAHAQIGRPYRWGGESPGTGFDCSGLVFYAYGAIGVDLPRVVREQERVGKPVPAGGLQPGDLVFFRINGSRSDHVGVYLGDHRFVHAPRQGQPVRLDALTDPWWRERWTGSRRVTVAPAP
jgi:cell wall-associated NlpC family hydrolase